MSPLKPDFPHRIAGNLALDLANTISWRGTRREVDHLASIEDVLAWSRSVDLVNKGETFTLAEQKRLHVAIHQLRGAIDLVGTAIARDASPPEDAYCTIRDFAARSLGRATLTGAPSAMVFTGIDRVIGSLAWSALDLLRSSEIGRLKQCPPDDCRWLFLDRTKNASRRWCAMATCGNRAKKVVCDSPMPRNRKSRRYLGAVKRSG